MPYTINLNTLTTEQLINLVELLFISPTKVKQIQPILDILQVKIGTKGIDSLLYTIACKVGYYD